MTNIDQGEIVYRGETEKWSFIITEIDNYIKISVDGKRDHRGRVMWWKQSIRLFPEIQDVGMDRRR